MFSLQDVGLYTWSKRLKSVRVPQPTNLLMWWKTSFFFITVLLPFIPVGLFCVDFVRALRATTCVFGKHVAYQVCQGHQTKTKTSCQSHTSSEDRRTEKGKACAKLHLRWVSQKPSGSAKNLASAGPVVWHIKKSFHILWTSSKKMK